MLNGKIYGQATWVHRIGGKGYGLWPTPKAQEKMGYDSQGGKTFRPHLSLAVKMWRTPDTCAGGVKSKE
ncbi:unnamed protein product, partial [marine sediment metagenome]